MHKLYKKRYTLIEMKYKDYLPAIALGMGLLTGLTLMILLCVLLIRSPVLVVADQSFLYLYGMSRVKAETRKSSLALFRLVRVVTIADDAGDDIVPYAIADASSRPHIVFFPSRFARAAGLYREQNPAITVVILEGRLSFEEGTGENYFLYGTDFVSDLHRAAKAAVILDNNKNKKTAVFLEEAMEEPVREAFLRALEKLENPPETSFFTSFSSFYTNEGLSSVVLAGFGAEYLDRYLDVPVVFFTWISPEFLPKDVVLVFDDSPFVQIVPAARMAKARLTKGQIPSRILVLSGKDLEKGIVRKLRKI